MQHSITSLTCFPILCNINRSEKVLFSKKQMTNEITHIRTKSREII